MHTAMWRQFEQCSASHRHRCYMTELEQILPKLPTESTVIKWIKVGERDIAGNKPEEYYCHIVIKDDAKRALVIAVLEEHMHTCLSTVIEGYVVGRHSIAVIPQLEDGATIGRNIVTCDG